MSISSQKISVETWYDLTMLTTLLHPDPDDDDHPAYVEVLEDQRRDHFNEAVETYLHDVEHSWDAYDGDPDNSSFEPPDAVLTELASTASRVAGLQRYLNKLIIYARLFAAEPASARTVAQVTGLSHSTIVPMATPELIAQVAAQVQPVARARLEALQPA